MKIHIVTSSYHNEVVSSLLDGALSTFSEAGISAESITTTEAPGAYEIPVIAAQAAALKQWDGILCLGCIVKGETPHFDVIAHSISNSLSSLSVSTLTPVAFGVLTTNTLEQARARAQLLTTHRDTPNSGTKSASEKQIVDNKGVESARALLATIRVCQQMKEEHL